MIILHDVLHIGTSFIYVLLHNKSNFLVLSTNGLRFTRNHQFIFLDCNIKIVITNLRSFWEPSKFNVHAYPKKVKAKLKNKMETSYNSLLKKINCLISQIQSFTVRHLQMTTDIYTMYKQCSGLQKYCIILSIIYLYVPTQ